MTDKDLAGIQQDLYNNTGDWDVLETGAGDDQVVWGCRKVGGVSIIALRGSVTFRDWMRDFDAFASPITHSRLGPVHPGFAMGMDQAWADIKAKTTAPRIVIGHSLGAARAAILTGLMVLDGEAPLLRVVWGEPKSGFGPLAAIVARAAGRSYRNGDVKNHDLVTAVPFTFPPEEYTRATPLIDICAPPAPQDAWGPLAWHHMPLYVEGTPDERIS